MKRDRETIWVSSIQTMQTSPIRSRVQLQSVQSKPHSILRSTLSLCFASSFSAWSTRINKPAATFLFLYFLLSLPTMAETTSAPAIAPATGAPAPPTNGVTAGAANAPNESNTANRGLPYYEKLRRELRDTLAKKRLMDKSMVCLRLRQDAPCWSFCQGRRERGNNSATGNFLFVIAWHDGNREISLLTAWFR
jgi:hypothetical protein